MNGGPSTPATATRFAVSTPFPYSTHSYTPSYESVSLTATTHAVSETTTTYTILRPRRPERRTCRLDLRPRTPRIMHLQKWTQKKPTLRLSQ